MFDSHGKITDQMLLPEGRWGFHPISRPSPVCAPAPWSRWQLRAKRGFDIGLALLVLTLGLPFLLAIALMVRLDSPGPVLFCQRRIGLNGREFPLWKFRTMYEHSADSDHDCCGGLRQATRNDPRVTRVGAWLRRTSLDESPQFLNVLLGQMSVVGPRPHAPGTCAGGRKFEEVTAHYGDRHRVRPGVTGLAQVRGWRGETDTEQKLLRRVDSDLEYIDRWSLVLDFAIIWRTIFVVLRMRNAY